MLSTTQIVNRKLSKYSAISINMKSLNQNKDNIMRADKKKEIVAKLESLQSDLEEYLEIWKKTGGGTSGHAIGSLIKSVKKNKDFFQNRC